MMIVPIRFVVRHPLVALGFVSGALPVSIGAVLLGVQGSLAGLVMVSVGLLVWTASGYGLIRALRSPSGFIGTAKQFLDATQDAFSDAVQRVGYRRTSDGSWRRPDAAFELRILAPEKEGELQVLTVTGPWPSPLAEMKALRGLQGIRICDWADGHA